MLLCGFKQTKGKRYENSDSLDRTVAGIGHCVPVNHLCPAVAGGGGMTLEELKAIPLQYTFGYSAEGHALRQYISDDNLIAKQVYTPRNKKTGEWGTGKSTFKLTDTNEEFDTLEGLLDAINKRNKQ